ncbi:hypothetical protein [Cellulophaga sp. HaHa_2_1]|uniref:hypothetical protein n=1 Tax=Cellulophaga sp. HaHa_2_1 TaxID=2749994 RepID=UPI001C4EC385|nr:hypothetical protein [Cellulophaga sp. HaHa_2_1]QXP53010.1 hypothetical protein H0I24_03515 [Cellulophaga sp. HaHa_2_1]
MSATKPTIANLGSMKQSWSSLEKRRNTILNIGYGMIAFKSSLKRALRRKFNRLFTRRNAPENTIDRTVIKEMDSPV